MHVINVDIQDNHEEATLGAFLICELCQCVSVPPLPLPHSCSGPGVQVCLPWGPREQSLPEGHDQDHLLLTQRFYQERGCHAV